MAIDSNHNLKSDGTASLRGLFVSQFFGAFNDNAWKMMVVLLAMQAAIEAAGGQIGQQTEALQQKNTALCFIVFTLPLMLVSLPAGALADRFSKRSIILATKAFELALMIAGTLLLYLWPGQISLLLVVLGLMGLQSALFSPAKYGILPELLSHERLSWGNGLLEMWTFIAIVSGTAAGGFMLDASGGQSWLVGAALSVAALTGLVAAGRVPIVKPAGQGGGVIDTVRAAWKIICSDRVLYLAVAGSVLYWSVASLVGQDVLVYTKSITHGLPNSDTLSVLPLGLLGLGVGAGSVLAGRWSARKVEYGLIPLGTVGMSLAMLALGVIGPGMVGTIVLMVLLGVSSGMVVVPLNAILQWRSPAPRRGAVIAVTNVVVFAGILVGSLTGYALSMQGLNARAILVAAALVVVVSSVWAIYLLPVAAVRLCMVAITHTFYRLKVFGAHHLPATGGALLVPNHMSFVDGLLILTSTDRPVRFVVDASYFNRWWLRPLMRAAGAIPISATGGPRVILQALRDAGDYLDRGELVCIFPEGQISRTGSTMPFRRGMERIIKGRGVPMIPVHLGGLWGSIFSYIDGRFMTKWPRHLRYPTTVSFGMPMPAGTPMFQVRQAVLDLARQAWQRRADVCNPLHRTYIRRVRARPFEFAFGDRTRPRVRRLGSLAGAITLARLLRAHGSNRRRLGILLPPSVPAALVNIAASIAGRASVNLNYTAGADGMASAIDQAQLTVVVTSRVFLKKAKLPLPANASPLYLEDLVPSVSVGSKIAAIVLALFAPCRLIEHYCGAPKRPVPQDEATLIFSSGSTGQPKGVILTHANIDSNVEGVAQLFHAQRGDKMLGILPHFHSFGYMTLWLAANHGIGVVFHPNPLDADAIGQLVDKNRLTVLIATPTFLQLYLRRCNPGTFGSLRLVLTGAEKLSTRLADAFEQAFGIRPIEGYGTTECSPVVAVSSPDIRYGGIYQAGSKRGYVGQPLPGVSVRVVDPDSFEALGADQPGMLLVKGPNVMRGYLNREDLTKQAMRDGWYITGDIAMIDVEGFLKITDRLSRFSKIGGEMVPHGKIEEALHTAAQVSEQTFAVTAVTDPKKGERLVVLHTFQESEIPGLVSKLTEMGLPNLFIPRPNQFIAIDQLPVLGTGKLDLRQIKKIAMEKTQ